MRTTHRSLHVFVLRNAPGGVSMKGGNQSIYYTDLYLVFAAYFPVCDNHNEFLQYIKYDNCTPKNISNKNLQMFCLFSYYYKRIEHDQWDRDLWNKIWQGIQKKKKTEISPEEKKGGFTSPVSYDCTHSFSCQIQCIEIIKSLNPMYWDNPIVKLSTGKLFSMYRTIRVAKQKLNIWGSLKELLKMLACLLYSFVSEMWQGP